MGINNSAIETVNARAAVDREFRDLLKQDPSAAIAQATGIQIGSNVQLKFVEKEKGVDAMFVLPDFTDVEAELSAEELEAVAGGTEESAWCDNVCITTTTQVTVAEA